MMLKPTRFFVLPIVAVLAVASAAGVVYAEIDGTITCAGNLSCISGANTGGGIGVLGTNTGTGVGVKGVAGSNAAVAGIASSVGTGILGQGASGVYGQGGKDGVYGASTNGFGVYAYAGGVGTGVYAIAVNGTGLLAQSKNGIGVQAAAPGMGLYADSASSTGTLLGSSASGAGVEGSSSSSSGIVGTGSSSAIAAYSDTNLFVGTDTSNDTVFYVDSQTNMYYTGVLEMEIGLTKSKQRAVAYAEAATTPTIEHSGTAHLVNGATRVSLDPSFARLIGFHDSYRVFVTPDGPTRGLFVTDKSASGFVVRELQSGRSTLDLDYRIVATPLGREGERIHSVAKPQIHPLHLNELKRKRIT